MSAHEAARSSATTFKAARRRFLAAGSLVLVTELHSSARPATAFL
jgi:hypothetical protein